MAYINWTNALYLGLAVYIIGFLIIGKIVVGDYFRDRSKEPPGFNSTSDNVLIYTAAFVWPLYAILIFGMYIIHLAVCAYEYFRDKRAYNKRKIKIKDLIN